MSRQRDRHPRGQARSAGALAAREDTVLALGTLRSWAETRVGGTGMDECPGRAAKEPGVPAALREQAGSRGRPELVKTRRLDQCVRSGGCRPQPGRLSHPGRQGSPRRPASVFSPS